MTMMPFLSSRLMKSFCSASVPEKGHSVCSIHLIRSIPQRNPSAAVLFPCWDLPPLYVSCASVIPPNLDIRRQPRAIHAVPSIRYHCIEALLFPFSS